MIRSLLWMCVIIVISGLSLSCSEKTTQPNSVNNPTASSTEGTYLFGVEISLNCTTPGAEIRYTLDGSTPAKESQVYTEPFWIYQSSQLKMKAFKDGMNSSQMVILDYVISDAGMAFVEGGMFFNGVSDVTISSFEIAKHEVSQASYIEIMGTNPSSFPNSYGAPVNQVNWYNAIEYCNRRSIKEGFDPCYSFDTYGTNPDDWPEGWDGNVYDHIKVSCDWTKNGYRLPTEMEWMFAAKGGILSEDYAYSGSDTLDAVGWFYDNSNAMPHPIGVKAPNELGIYDMSGNLWEWCWDIYTDALPTTPQSNPTGAISGNWRSNRSGSWGSYEYYCRVNWRDKAFTNWSYHHQGFRVCRRP